LATAVGLAPADLDIRPGPVGASTGAAYDGVVVSARAHCTRARDVLDRQVRDGNAAGWVTLEIAAVVVLLNQNTVSVEASAQSKASRARDL
jgi:hypothetical protein